MEIMLFDWTERIQIIDANPHYRLDISHIHDLIILPYALDQSNVNKGNIEYLRYLALYQKPVISVEDLSKY